MELADHSVAMKRPAETCGFYLEKRKRYCRTRPVDGLQFCPSHVSKAAEGIEPKPSIPETQLDLGSDILQPLPIVENQPFTGSAEPTESEGRVNGRPAPEPDRCHYWLERKRRFCKARVSQPQIYCVEHSVGTESEKSRSRISCPNDPKHSCYADQLERHLKKCNARPDLRPVYFVDGINSGESSEDVKVGIHDIDMSELNSIIDLVKTLHHDNVHITSSLQSHVALREEIEKPSNGAAALKHLQQQSSLVGNLESLGLLKDCCNYLEFGAGKGGLSHWVQLANKANVNTNYLLIDKSSVRYKKDVYHRGEDQGPDFKRLKIDIENLDLSKVEDLNSSSWPVVGTGKHLCGAATDFMLRCLTRAATDCKPNQQWKVDGMLVALCCHHRCDWKAYVGKEWFIERGLGPRHFSLITSMSAWATCGTRHVTASTDEKEQNEVNEKPDDEVTVSVDYNHPRYGKLLPEEREEIGFKCKQLIDQGRIHNLVKYGFDAKLMYYVDKACTLENTALSAVSIDQMQRHFTN